MRTDATAPVTDHDPDELAALIDGLMASGTQHINLDARAATRVTTVNSTDCGRTGACAVPNFDSEDPDEELYNEEDKI